MPLTAFLRQLSLWAWSLGLALIAFDFILLPVFEWRASLSYIFFGIAALAVAWAEKREFGTRVFLYRLHDAVIFSPWKFLLLYFLWVSVFSPFTQAPLASLVYAANGWMSLFAVGVSAQFIFCERTNHGTLLFPQRLRWAFFVYSITVSVFMGNALLHLFFPDTAWPLLVNHQVNLFLYFTLGMPFLLWDFLKEGRRLLPRWFSVLTMWLGTVAILLVGKRIHFAALSAVLFGVFGLFFYKRIRAKILVLGLAATAVAILLTVVLAATLRNQPIWDHSLELARQAMENRMKNSLAPAWDAAVASNYLGRGVGVTDLRGVWSRVLAEAGPIGLLFYASFFLMLLRDLYRVRHSSRVVVSNVSAVSLGIFLLLLGHHVENPYGAYIWVWYALWALFASTSRKRIA